ncbi:nuclease-related domain-containing DEAD/DEAH box helicase [Pseudobacteriovorax antillogorgiicola]|uniref:DNA 3'-5' helicase II n=1 Tax=Pseudobacteriovorax antillogorgiicola TaxID=1513793 RepID=A0A1Y6CQL4_9BACT|nr:NERD domain-containing protein [Pseudobacteriovorax antillogorgiicola]TCS41476.1 uncharacterized protein DUF2075 [Pseudobacteriovorax antillogorgiicola]SMF83591.1 Uncharacterized conserved protein [Pseudobacteriovorax antillogorgiicola]
MATVYPDSNRRRVIFASRAEEQVYNITKSLSKDWRAYYSCTLSALEPGKGLQDNEIDFVLYHPRWGIFAIEVKGGQIKYDADAGKFYSINRYGKSFAIRNPFQQALVWKSRFLRYLKRSNLKCPATHLVCFPTADETQIQASAEVEPKLILGRHRLQNLEAYLKEIAKAVHPEKYLKFQDIGQDLDTLLKGSTYETKLFIRDYLDNHEMRVKDVEVIHETLITPVASSKRLAVEGEAGTGKTMLAIMLAKHFRNQGKEVLLLSSNPLLNSFMKTEVGDKVNVMTYAELASSYGIELLRRPNGFDGSREDWIQYVGPERLKEAIASSEKRYEVLLCDEAQDVQPFWWESIETALKDDESHFYIFFDRSQGVFGSGSSDSSFVPEDVLPIGTPYFPLVHNYRTTREICGFSRSFRTGKEILRSHSGRLGYVPELIVYEDEQDAQDKLQELLDRLYQKEGLMSHETTILSARRPFHEGSVLNGINKLGAYEFMNLGELKQRTMPTAKDYAGKVPISTISSFKGLETHVGIIANISEYNLPLTNPIMSSLLYVACTRAKHMLYIMVKKGDSKQEVIESALQSIEKTGAMVVDSNTISNEFVGEVTHYNPDRLGWLKVKDPAFEKASIMFFPHDVRKADIGDIKVGMKLRFTPRQEGFTTVAEDLVIADEELQADTEEKVG